jgi:dienelactone hydrolase
LARHFSLTTSDSHTLAAYRADPSGKPKGAMVVAQEIFGVNSHIRNVCDRLAAHGYVAVAPALFDRFVRDFQSGYSADEVAHARSYLGKIDWPKMLLDIQAGIDDVKAVGPVGVIGFCMGGSAAFLAATRLTGSSIMVGRSSSLPTRSRNVRCRCISARPTPAFRCRMSRLSSKSARTAKSSPIPPATASIATSAQASTTRPPSSPKNLK